MLATLFVGQYERMKSELIFNDALCRVRSVRSRIGLLAPENVASLNTVFL
jgi:hypothetical protein